MGISTSFTCQSPWGQLELLAWGAIAGSIAVPGILQESLEVSLGEKPRGLILKDDPAKRSRARSMTSLKERPTVNSPIHPSRKQLSRRGFLTVSGLSVAAAAGVASQAAAQAQSSAGSSFGSSLGSSSGVPLLPKRPVISHGVASGEMTNSGAVIWTRADRPARMVVEAATDKSFKNAWVFRGSAPLTPATDGTGRLRISGMPAGRDIHYRVFLEDMYTGLRSEPTLGMFRTAPVTARDIRFHWSGDVAGQGFGINPKIGGMRGWATMAQRNPHFFLHSGDVIYADNPIEEKVKLDDGRIWHNLVSEETSKVAETLKEFRGRYAYNLRDENYKNFNAHVPQLVQWDDHETTNNWYPGEILQDDKYAEKRVDVLSARSLRAFHEWQPVDQTKAVDGRVYRKVSYGPLLDVFILDMRSYKDSNDKHSKTNTKPGWILGEKQRKWLIDGVKQSKATWKIIANDLPLGIVVPDGEAAQEGVSSGTPGKPVGREQEIATVLSAIKNVKNVVWLTADVHYCAAHEYHPDRAAFQDFAPFWEFVSGPLNAGAFGPNKMDPTFGPEVVFSHTPQHQNQSPLDDYQHFGEVDIDGKSRELTVRLISTQGKVLYTKTLPAR